MRFFRIVSCMLLLVLMAVATAWADVRLPAIFSDHMVLQQGQPVPVWGWADPGEKVTVELGKCRASATACDHGKWKVELAALEPGEPLEMTVSGKNTLTLTDILMGEVWICSGQSNMQWSVSRADNPEEEIAAAKHPNIRLFTVTRKISQQPLDDCDGAWAACSPETVPNFSAVAYFFGRELHQELGVPVGLVNTSWGGTIAEAWTSHEGLVDVPDFEPILERAAKFNPKTPNQASVLFNGMINPVIPFGIRGAIWYQGESNVTRAEQYQKLFPAMICNWRKQWDQGEFPFIFVQLAPYRYTRNDPLACAELREAQRLTLSLPNTGMAVTTDIGNTTNIHPKNKQEVGRRLALWTLANSYGKKVVFSGPLYESSAVEGTKIRVNFQHACGGLVAKEGDLTHFEIAGSDGQFVSATATIDGQSVLVESDQISKPAAVRFGWRDDAEPNLFNAEGLPASPFRTDQFELVTAGEK